MKENIMDQKMIDGDEFESTLRPQTLNEYVGQEEIKEMMKVFIYTASAPLFIKRLQMRP